MKYCVIKKDVTASSFVPLILTAVLACALCVLASFYFSFIPILILIIAVIAIFWLSPRFLRQEYEYSLDGGEFTVSLIMNKASLKKLFSEDFDKLMSCAPEETHRPTASSRVKAASGENPRYAAQFSSDGGVKEVIFSPSSEFLEAMRLMAPSKVRLS